MEWVALTRKPNYKPIICAKCGEVTKHTAPHQKYCKPCAVIAERESIIQWQKDHPEKHREHVMRWRNTNMERYLETNRIWKLNNPDHDANYHAEHLLEAKAARHRRRARIKGNGGSYTAKELQCQLTNQDYCCYYCNKPLFNGNLDIKFHVDHMTPLVRGGTNEISNIVIACPPCNLSKSTQTAEEFMRKLNG